MSLDVYLGVQIDTGGAEPFDVDLYDANITHNLAPMAREAGIYEYLWRPEELGIETAAELIEQLCSAVEMMELDPGRFKAFNPSNGWGSYEGFVAFVRAYLQACQTHPKAKVYASR